MHDNKMIGYLFDEPVKESFYYNGVDSDITEMIAIISTLKQKVLGKKITNGNFIRNSSKEVGELERLVKKRFGVNIHLIGADKGSAFVIIPPHKDSNSVSTASSVIYKDIMDWSDTVDLSELPENTIKDGDTDILTSAKDLNKNRMYTLAYQEMNKLREDYINEKITIDYEHIYVNGLTSVFVIAIDFNTFINDYNLSAKELLATLLHEIGHAITHSVSTNQRLMSTFNLMDTLVDFKTGKIKVGGHVKTQNDFINVLDSVDKIAKSYSKEASIAFNSERTADMFTVQLGLGEELSSALYKIGGLDSFRVSDVVLTYITILPLLIILTIALTSGEVFIALSTMSALTTAILHAISPSMRFEIPHGDGYERLKAIRSQIIANIRKQSDKMTREDLAKQIKAVDKMEDMLKMLKADRTTVNYISDLMLGLTDYIGMIDLSKRLTSVINNKLHVQKHQLKEKIKQHKG